MITVIEMPALSSTMKDGKVVKWYKKEGDAVEKGEVLFEVETDKVNVEVESLASGWLRKIIIEEGIEVPVHTTIAIISESMDEDISSVLESTPPISASTVAEEPDEETEKGPKKKVEHAISKPKISPLARRIAEEKGIDIRILKGTGPGGRITGKDVEAAMEDLSKAPPEPAQTWAKQDALSEAEGYEDVALTKIKKVSAERLQASKVTAPHFYVDVTADATGMTKLKDNLEKRSEKPKLKISFNDIVIKVVSQALKEFPMVNASFLGDRIRVYKAINIGVAVAIDEGLVVPVVRNADQKSILQISHEVVELASKARNKKLLPHEYQGGTFTITNLGMFGVERFHAIINPPESGILAVGAIISKPISVEDEVAIRPCLKLSLSVDHRVVDGALAAQFLACIKKFVEAPEFILE